MHDVSTFIHTIRNHSLNKQARISLHKQKSPASHNFPATFPFYFHMGKWRILFLITALFCALQAQAQWDTPFGQYWAVRGYYNPSFAGETEQINLSGAYRYEWAGIDYAPRKVLISADAPVEFLGMRHGVGLTTYTENTGQAGNSLFAAQYALKKRAGNGFLSIGVQAGIYRLNFDAGNIRLHTDSVSGKTSVRVNPADKQVFDLHAGISYTTKKLTLGASAMHINQARFFAVNDSSANAHTQPDSAYTQIPRSYNFLAAYNITLFSPLEIQPMLWVQTDFADAHVQATLRWVYNEKYSAGASWIKKDGYVFFAGATVQGVEAGYAYTLHKRGIGKESGGSHEISIRYRLPIDLWDKKMMPHKSIRLL